jgi:hypothetical protein
VDQYSGGAYTVVVSFTLTRAEFLSAWRRLCTKQWRQTWRLPLLGFALAVLGVVDSTSAVMIGAGAWVAIFCPLASYVLRPRDLWQRAEHGPQTHTFTEDQITAVLPNSETRYAWRHWRDVSLVGDTYVLSSERGYVFIPRRAFPRPEDEQRFRDLSTLAGAS